MHELLHCGFEVAVAVAVAVGIPVPVLVAVAVGVAVGVSPGQTQSVSVEQVSFLHLLALESAELTTKHLRFEVQSVCAVHKLLHCLGVAVAVAVAVGVAQIQFVFDVQACLLHLPDVAGPGPAP